MGSLSISTSTMANQFFRRTLANAPFGDGAMTMASAMFFGYIFSPPWPAVQVVGDHRAFQMAQSRSQLLTCQHASELYPPLSHVHFGVILLHAISAVPAILTPATIAIILLHDRPALSRVLFTLKEQQKHR
jgi:hypothetical protein